MRTTTNLPRNKRKSQTLTKRTFDLVILNYLLPVQHHHPHHVPHQQVVGGPGRGAEVGALESRMAIVLHVWMNSMVPS
jgi:hypothetical protein